MEIACLMDIWQTLKILLFLVEIIFSLGHYIESGRNLANWVRKSYKPPKISNDTFFKKKKKTGNNVNITFKGRLKKW